MIRRSRARIVVLQVLAEDDMNPQRDWEQSDVFLEQRLRHFPDVLEFAQSLLTGVRRERPALDQYLAALAENWNLERIAVTDRNAIRLGMYEILHAGTPGPVAINEAVELAKRFGTASSGQFVNGILDRFLQSPSSIVTDAPTEPTSEEAESPEEAGAPEETGLRKGAGPLKRVWSLKRGGRAEQDKSAD